jgi:hypothetical protein
MERRIQARHFHDEVDCSSGLAPELQSRARPNQFNPLYRVEDWCVMGFGKTELLVFERHTVFQHLRELAALRIQAAIPKVNNRRLGLFADDYAGVVAITSRKSLPAKVGNSPGFTKEVFLPH